MSTPSGSSAAERGVGKRTHDTARVAVLAMRRPWANFFETRNRVSERRGHVVPRFHLCRGRWSTVFAECFFPHGSGIVLSP